MDLISFQYDRSFVLEALRQGDIDYLEHVSEAAEADLFRHLIRRQVIQRLAETYPTPRKKEEVPVWIYLSSELTLKLHGAQSYHAFPRILRCGGLIEALGPEMGGRQTPHPETGDVTWPAQASTTRTITIARLPAIKTSYGLGRGLLSWSQCPVPLTAVVNRERDERGQTKDWVLVSTADRFSAAQIRSTYELRPAIEERHRQYKCFWDLTRMHSCAFSLVVNQALMVLWAYTLVQAHLVLRQRKPLTGGIGERTWQLLSPTLEVVAVYYRQRFCLLTLAEFGRILLDVAEPVRGKLGEKLRRIERDQYSLLETARPP